MQIEVLGPIQLSTDQGVTVDVAERHLRLLLAALVAADGEPVSTDALVERLWDRDPPANPRKVLRAKLSRLRTLLDNAQAGTRDLLTHTPAGYRLAVRPENVDAGRFNQAVEHARRMTAAPEKAETLQTALEMWRGEPYGDATDEIWLAPAITELRELRGDALELLAETLLDQGEPERALMRLSGAVHDHPSRERLISAMMLALYQVGRQHEALEMFESLRRLLAEDLGVDPSPHLHELHNRILRHDPALAPSPEAATVATVATPVSVGRSNVPAETTPLIGRQREIQQIAALLDESRLVTLTGIGGVGKTRLALHLARNRQAHVEQGIWFLDLTELPSTAHAQPVSGERVASLAASVLDLPEQDSTVSEIDRLSEALRPLSTLLVLDNCEHVVGEAAAFITELLGKVPAVRVLTTSREPLAVPEEHRYNVGTLNTEPESPKAVSEAVEFFTVRARSSDPTFHLDQETIPTVTELCRRLDGLPLALELAAARIRGISVRDLLERLSNRLNILHRPGHRVPRRQQTLRGTIDWSWSLLDQAEQTVLRRLAAHSGGVPLSAAEAICADHSEEVRVVVGQAQVADVLSGLVDRSMVVTVSTPTGVRYGLLESIATFAAEKLDDSGERAGVSHRHLHYYLNLAREAERHLRGPGQRDWMARLETERTQLRTAFDEAVRTRDGGSAIALTMATFWYQWISGRHRTLSENLAIATDLPGPRDNTYAAAATLSVSMNLESHSGEEAALVEAALSIFSSDDVARARTQWFAGTALLAVGLREAGEHHIDAATDILMEAGADWDLAVATSQRNWFIVNNWGDPPRGLPDGRDPEQVLRDVGDGWGLAQALAVEYRIAETEGDHLRAAHAARRTLEVSLEFELWAEASDWLSATARAALRSGDVPSAAAHLARARSLATEMAYAHGGYAADFAGAMIARYEGKLDQAQSLLERWVSGAALQAIQDPNTHIERGFLAVQHADLSRAEKALRTLRVLISPAGETAMTANVLELAAAVHALRGEATAAAEMLGTATALRERIRIEASAPARRDIDRVHATVHEHVPRSKATVAFDRGRGADPDRQLRTLALTL